ncbi:M56 family metallopeptidase [Pontibacter anaerobius]|uniref:M56 family metallopeptidase n=1 Tax=Pontibacter anaerobius TaxID=2993940 RepID=A0ABT3RDH8_9BACT|nr:M56 family metallopeptidase [Pontibacter anaerobius]MCX2739898.1 M56 family metallopeptidase [Pontibacter anaerobius]
MEELLNYAIKAGIGLLVLYLFYYALLRRQNNFAFNRAYLLAAPLVALFLPLLSWPAILAPDTLVSQTLQAVQLSEVVVTAYRPEAAAATGAASSLSTILTILYFTGLVLILTKLGRQLWQIRQLKAASTPVLVEVPAEVFQLQSHYPAFAFGNSIFLSRQQEQLNRQEQEQVLAHELAHVELGHTWDVLFYEILSAILWFHPAIWLIKEELRDVHEYQADAAVVKEHQTQKYTSLLSREALLSMGLPVGSHFTKPQVLKRLHMLQRQGQKPGWLRPLLTLPLLAGLAFILARQQVTAEKQSITTTTQAPSPTEALVPALESPSSTKEKPYTFVEQMPTFEGGETELMKFLGKNVRYPKQAQQAGTEGLVVLSFVVEDDGSLHEIQVLKGVEPSIDAEAMRVVEMMDGKWSPGTQNGKPVPVRYTLPVRFAMK